MFMLDPLIALLYKYSFISNFEISPFSIYEVSIILHPLFVKILRVSLGHSNSESKIISFSNAYSNTWNSHSCISDSFVILNIGSFELEPMTR